MNYSSHYKQLVLRAIDRIVDGYTEKHHVIPLCISGVDDSVQVRLTPEEHFVAHQLLVKMFPSNKSLAQAAHMMTVDRKSNKRYGWLKRRHIESMKGNKSNLGRICITNGVRDMFIFPTNEMPVGFWKGLHRRNKGPEVYTEEMRAKMRKPKSNTERMGKYVRTAQHRNKSKELMEKIHNTCHRNLITGRFVK